MKKFAAICLIFLPVALFFSSCNPFGINNDNDIRFEPNTERVGVYWWAYWLISDFTYLDFAASNGITEIYLSVPNLRYARPDGTFSLNAMNNIVNPTREFISRASEKGINVYLLLGNNGSWIRNRYEFHRRMNGLRVYQELAEPHERFAGVQLNVEPHQLENPAGVRYWGIGSPHYPHRQTLVQELADFATMAHQTYYWVNICWTLTFWWDNRHMVNGGSISLGEHLISLSSNTVYVMGFRNTAANMVSVSRYMIETAQRMGRDIVLLATVFEGTPIAEFVGMGREHMYEQLNLVRGIAGCSSVHVAIHHIVTWRHWERRDR